MIVFYEVFADCEATFSNGGKLNFNGALLSAESTVFCHILMSSNEITIEDFDSDTFKLFTDCLMEFKNYEVTDALLILPIACKYEVLKCIDQCSEILKPTELNENLCLALNLACYYNCEKLAKYIVDDFLVKEYLIQRIFYEEKFCFLLEPESVSALLSKTKVDSYLIELVFKWGQQFLKEKNKNLDVKDFFAAYNIDNYIKLECFENLESVFKFNESDLGLNFFTPAELLAHTRKMLNIKSEWVHINKEESITEIFVVDSKNCFVCLNDFDLRVRRNEVVFYEVPPHTRDMISWDIYYYKVEADKEKEHHRRNEKNYNVENLCAKNIEWFYGSNTGLDDVKGEFKIEVRYKFWCDCRILKTTFSPSCVAAKFVNKNPEELCFTNNIVIKKRN